MLKTLLLMLSKDYFNQLLIPLSSHTFRIIWWGLFENCSHVDCKIDQEFLHHNFLGIICLEATQEDWGCIPRGKYPLGGSIPPGHTWLISRFIEIWLKFLQSAQPSHGQLAFKIWFSMSIIEPRQKKEFVQYLFKSDVAYSTYQKTEVWPVMYEITICVDWIRLRKVLCYKSHNCLHLKFRLVTNIS